MAEEPTFSTVTMVSSSSGVNDLSLDLSYPFSTRASTTGRDLDNMVIDPEEPISILGETDDCILCVNLGLSLDEYGTG